MCTVTAVPMRAGFRVACNRDEQNSRPSALPPRRYLIGVRTALFPLDPLGGGTWIGVNDAGLALAVLNRNDVGGPHHRQGARQSRGLIIPPLLGCDCIAEVLDVVGSLDGEGYDPFHLCVIERGGAAFISSKGRELSIERHPLVRPMLFTSSSLGDELVSGPRSQLFNDLVLAPERSWLEGQENFHAHQWPERPHLSVVMRRDDARTVSRSYVEVSHHAIRFHYEPLPRLQPTLQPVLR